MRLIDHRNGDKRDDLTGALGNERGDVGPIEYFLFKAFEGLRIL
jgi:hypothetical protein